MMFIFMKNNNIFSLFSLSILLCDLYRGTRFYLNLGQKLGCNLYMDATYTRVIMVLMFLYINKCVAQCNTNPQKVILLLKSLGVFSLLIHSHPKILYKYIR